MSKELCEKLETVIIELLTCKNLTEFDSAKTEFHQLYLAAKEEFNNLTEEEREEWKKLSTQNPDQLTL
ncbi:hypothetical protein [Lacunimicrobium album]